MKFLYKAYACEKVEQGKLLMPGFPVEATSKPIAEGSKIKVELADGTTLETVALKSKYHTLTPSVLAHLNIRSNAMFHCAIQVPDEFDPPGIQLGASVFLVE